MLVANGNHVTAPVWSPDGKLLAYAADLYGNNDVFLVAAEGMRKPLARASERHSNTGAPL